ncbi:hypothetical protein EK21DRAFT_79478, partial [Setomelanomma holmii]
DAIESANLNRLRTVLREICLENAEAFKLASDKMFVTSAASLGGDKIGNSRTGGMKRKASTVQNRYETCVQCKEEYDVLDNPDDACEWHEGETEVDWDGGFWDDHDEDCYGTIDDEDSREMYPEGFKWSCCENKGDEDGCMSGPHRPDPVKRVRRG